MPSCRTDYSGFYATPAVIGTDPASDSLRVSKIFDWYGSDFEQGWRAYRRLSDVFAPFAAVFSDDPQVQQRIRDGRVKIGFCALRLGAKRSCRFVTAGAPIYIEGYSRHYLSIERDLYLTINSKPAPGGVKVSPCSQRIEREEFPTD